jgi:hypothetical protein
VIDVLPVRQRIARQNIAEKPLLPSHHKPDTPALYAAGSKVFKKN